VKAAVLRLDNALVGQSALSLRLAEAGAESVDAMQLGPKLRLWARAPTLEALRAQVRAHLPARMGPRLVFSGSGDFHHATPTLLARTIEATDGPVTVIHIDNHPDWVRYANGLHCGSWVGAAARLPGVARVVTLGVCSGDIGQARRRQGDLALIAEDRLQLFAYRAPDGGATLEVAGRSTPTIEALGVAAFCERLLAEIATSNVYITIDKDALCAADAATNWDQGRLSLADLQAILRAVMSGHRIIGADVVGDWSTPIYGGGFSARLLKRGEAMLDQPWRAPADADQVNEIANLQLLDLFSEAA